MLKDYYENSSSMPEEIAVRRDQKAEVVQPTSTKKATKASAPIPEGKDLTDDWVEDEDGNFVKPEDLAKKED